MVLKDFVTFRLIFQFISAYIYGGKNSLLLPCCFPSDCQPVSENSFLIFHSFRKMECKPSGFTCTLVSPLCVYKISQVFSFFNMEYYIKRRIRPCAKHRFAHWAHIFLLTYAFPMWYACCVWRPYGCPFSCLSCADRNLSGSASHKKERPIGLSHTVSWWKHFQHHHLYLCCR